MYNLSGSQPSMGGYQLPQQYSLMGNYGQPSGFDGAGGGGFSFAPLSSVAQLGSNAVVPETAAPGIFSSFFPQQSKDPISGAVTTNGGYGQAGLGIAQGAFNAWMGMKQYGLAKQQLAEGKQQFALNYDAQRTTTNAQLQDRQNARIAGNGGLAGSGYQSVGDYMMNNGIKPRG